MLGQLGPDFQNFLGTLADHTAKTQTSDSLLDKPCRDALYREIFRILRSLLYFQALNKIPAAIFEGANERIYGPTFAIRGQPACLAAAECSPSQPRFPSMSAPPVIFFECQQWQF
jgi:hypothetical protein